MRLKVDLSLHNSQCFTIWNKITHGPHSASSVLHAPPRWKADGWSGLKAHCDCISQVRGCWRGAPALSQQSVVWYRLCWKGCRTSLPQQLPWERFWLRKLYWHLLPLLLFSHFHKGCICLPLGEHSLGCLEDNKQVFFCPAFIGIIQNERGKMGKMEMDMSLFQTCALRHMSHHLVWQMNVLKKTKDLRN